MAIEHGGYNFESIETHDDVAPGPWDLRDARRHFFDVQGESEIGDALGGRNLSCRMVLREYATAQELIDVVDTFNRKTNTLTGTLTVTGNVAATYGDCTFKGAERGRVIRNAVDGKYLCEVLLRWRQHKVDSS